MTREPEARGPRRAAVFPVVLGAAGVAVAFSSGHHGIEASVLVLASIAWVAWMAGRSAGSLLALAGGLLHLVGGGVRPSRGAVLAAALWLGLYLLLATAVSAIEAATRPKG